MVSIALWFVAMQSFAQPQSAATAPSAVPSTAPQNDGCPRAIFIFNSSVRGGYVAMFSSKEPVTASLRMTLYTKSAAFVVTHRTVAVDRSARSRAFPYRSYPLLIVKPPTQSYVSAR